MTTIWLFLWLLFEAAKGDWHTWLIIAIAGDFILAIVAASVHE